MAPELCGTSCALAPEPQQDPNTAQNPHGTQAAWGQFLRGSALQEEKGNKLSLGKFPAMLGTRDGLQVWALPPDLGSQAL